MMPYKNYTNKQLKELIVLQFMNSDCPPYVGEYVNLAFEDSWDPVNEFDGCTVVQDFNHPDLSCFIHDWLWRTGKGGDFSNKLFYKIMRWEGVSKSLAKRRYMAVKIMWNIWYKYKKRKKNEFSLEYVKNKIKK